MNSYPLIPQSLYRPEFEHDACGVGFIANITGRREQRIVQFALEALESLAHRGALDADAKTGDGAGILVQLPKAFFKREAEKLGVKAVEEEGSPAFGTALGGAAIDMAEIARLLEELHSLDVVEGLADEVNHRLSDLILAFEEEIARRREEPGDEKQKPDESGESGKPVLVPPIVEIKLLRRLQLDVNGKLDSFWRRNPSLRDGRVDDVQRRTLERLYNEQGHIADDLEKLIKSVFDSNR